jgi:Uma2 family endonuclease
MMLVPLSRPLIMGRVSLRQSFAAEQRMGMPVQKAPRWTTADVRALMDESRPWPRYELINGKLIVTPAPSWAHQRAVALLWQALNEYLLSEPVGVVMMSPSDIELEPGVITQPDVFVVPTANGRHPKAWLEVKTLLVAAEVLSPSNARYDRVDKRKFFQRVAVPQYWVIDLDARIFERWTPSDVRPEVIDAVIDWHPAGASKAFEFDVAQYFADVHRDGETESAGPA